MMRRIDVRSRRNLVRSWLPTPRLGTNTERVRKKRPGLAHCAQWRPATSSQVTGRTTTNWSLELTESTKTTTAVPTVTLNNGVEIPQLGFGVFQIEPADTVAAVTEALKVGYRHIDTAEMYGNEKEVGEAIAQSELDPTEVFVTSKLNNGFHAFDDALRA